MIRELPLDCIRIDRTPFSRVLALTDYLRRGGRVPPIKVVKIPGGYRIADGRHRWAAFKLLGRDKIHARIGGLR